MKLRAKFDAAAATPQDPAPVPKPKLASDDLAGSPAARNLALAHHIGKLIDQGLIADYTAAARLLGVSQPRVTHLMGLLLLAPTIQEAILAGTLEPREKQLRELARIADWSEQIDRLSHMTFPRPASRRSA